eukprot:CAMPEP_0182462908 /NCGR_PEP_ID=MMETSP1319-20130603/7012_1 /TAXON_ID=172717 /ORGANISM="Bolidomonas pacifica, Strain RCC208" /LENGTH=65 /DNA_ID=CAMNT_0024662387 /DNA_START=171 /DNA_END=364 /DNA_ORIENTATION=-
MLSTLPTSPLLLPFLLLPLLNPYVSVHTVSGTSMSPSLEDGDVVLAVSRRYEDMREGDVVTLLDP